MKFLLVILCLVVILLLILANRIIDLLKAKSYPIDISEEELFSKDGSFIESRVNLRFKNSILLICSTDPKNDIAILSKLYEFGYCLDMPTLNTVLSYFENEHLVSRKSGSYTLN